MLPCRMHVATVKLYNFQPLKITNKDALQSTWSDTKYYTEIFLWGKNNNINLKDKNWVSVAFYPNFIWRTFVEIKGILCGDGGWLKFINYSNVISLVKSYRDGTVSTSHILKCPFYLRHK